MNWLFMAHEFVPRPLEAAYVVRVEAASCSGNETSINLESSAIGVVIPIYMTTRTLKSDLLFLIYSVGNRREP